MSAQRTLRRSVSCTGIGLHSGNKVTLSLKPAPADYGIRFQRSDLGGLEIPATVTHLGGIQYQTGLTREAVSVETVEHLLAALTALGIDNVIVELNHPEVPIMDGSAAPFVYLILNEAGVKRLQAPRRYLKVLRPISLTQGDKRIALYPSDHFKVTYSISFDHPLLRHQSRTMRITEESFVEEIAPARTFGFLKEVEMLRQRGLALGGSLDNAIVLGETGVLNNALRFEDEFVRHKILDVIGDLSLVGHPVIGHLVAHRGGHALHTAFAAKILEESDAWRIVEAPVGRAVVGIPACRPGAAKAAPRLATGRPEAARPQHSAQRNSRLHSSDHDQRLRRRLRSAGLEPVDPLAHQVELQPVASRACPAPSASSARRRARRRLQRCRQPRALEVAVDERAVARRRAARRGAPGAGRRSPAPGTGASTGCGCVVRTVTGRPRAGDDRQAGQRRR